MTTRVLSASVPVADQDAAVGSCTEVLGSELRTDVEVWPGARTSSSTDPHGNGLVHLQDAGGGGAR